MVFLINWKNIVHCWVFILRNFVSYLIYFCVLLFWGTFVNFFVLNSTVENASVLSSETNRLESTRFFGMKRFKNLKWPTKIEGTKEKLTNKYRFTSPDLSMQAKKAPKIRCVSTLKGQGHEIRMAWKWYGKVGLN